MMKPFIVNEPIANLIRLQRTWVKQDTSLHEVGKLYHKSCMGDYESILPYLPTRCKHILDIGCGVAGLDILLYRHYKSKTLLHLFDKNEKAKRVRYGYSDRPSAYNTISDTINFMHMNGVPSSAFDYTTYFPKKYRYGLILSIISCGFHYPVQTYLNFINKCLIPGGTLILDIRVETNQFKLLSKTFGNLFIINESKSYKRVLCRQSVGGLGTENGHTNILPSTSSESSPNINTDSTSEETST